MDVEDAWTCWGLCRQSYHLTKEKDLGLVTLYVHAGYKCLHTVALQCFCLNCFYPIFCLHHSDSEIVVGVDIELL